MTRSIKDKSMMQILGAFAKNLLEDEERSRQGMADTRECYKTQDYHNSHDNKSVYNKRNVVKNEDVTRIANKVTNSIACHIDRMVKKRNQSAGTHGSGYFPGHPPYGYDYSPFHNINNPFWAQQRKRKTTTTSSRKPVCPSCLRSFSATKSVPKSKVSSKLKLKKTKKKKEKSDKKLKKPKEEQKEAFVSVERPVFKTLSENLVQKPKTIWAKELLEEFREKAARDEEKKIESAKHLEKQKERDKTQKSRSKSAKASKPKLALKNTLKSINK